MNYERGFLKYPTASEENAANGGKFNVFEGGSIYWSSANGAHPVTGQIYETWAGNNYERGQYGYPVGDEETIGDGKRQRFQNGQYIEWHPSGFPGDWAGDSYQDDNASNNSDAYVPTCEDDCGTDASTKVNGKPTDTQPNSAFRVAAPSKARGDTVRTNSTPYCEDLTADASAPVSKKSFCIRRTTPANDLDIKPAPSTPSAAPSTNPSSTATTTAPTSPPSISTAPSAPSTTSESAPTPTPTPSVPSANPQQTAPTTTAPSESCTPTSTPASGQEASCATTSSVAPAVAPIQKKPLTVQPVDFYTPSQLDDDKDYCNSYAQGFPDAVWRGDRMFQCRTKVIVLELREARNNELIGRVYLRESRNQVMKWDNTAWVEHAYVYVQNVIAPGSESVLNESTVAWRLQCSCYSPGDGAGTSSITSTVGQLRTQEARITFRRGLIAQSQTSVQTQDSFDFAVTNPLITTVNGNTGNSRVMRCDAQAGLRGKQGCAFPDIAPVIDYSVYGSIPEFINHVKAAQQSQLPGAPNKTALHRVVAESTIDANRRGSCGGVTGPRDTRDCDEYPFASSDEGGRAGGPNSGGTARTFDFCGIKDTGFTLNGSGPNGYSACLIDSGQNRRAGANLGWFYAKNRIVAGDAFYVYVG